MFLLLILPILVSGFIICNTNPYYYYKIHRYEGQYLYLKSVHLGVISLTVFSLTALLIHKLVPPSIQIFEWEIPVSVINNVMILLDEVSPKEDSASLAWIMIISIGTILYSCLWSIVSSVLLRFKAGALEKSKILLMSKVLSDSPMDKLLFESYIHSRPLLLSLNSRKVYIGTINSLGEPNESEGMDQEISVIPLMSGYRDKETLKVQLTTYYEVIDTDLNIVIRQDQILSATWFDFDVYKKLSLKQSLVKRLLLRALPNKVNDV